MHDAHAVPRADVVDVGAGIDELLGGEGVADQAGVEQRRPAGLSHMNTSERVRVVGTCCMLDLLC